MIYFFVEGLDDRTFLNRVIIPKLENYDVKVIEYAQKTKKYINSFLKTIKSIDDDDYIFLVDMDNKQLEIRKNEIMHKYIELEEQKIFFSVQEIESWYLAGISDKLIKEYNISEGKIKKITNTEEINKESFNTLFNKMKIDPDLIFKLQMLNYFDLNKALDKNNSLRIFYEYINSKICDCFL